MGVLVLVAIALAIYFVPAMVANGKKRFGAILALNIFLGWTVLGWVAALVWAIAEEKASSVPDGDKLLVRVEKPEGNSPAWQALRVNQAVLLSQEGDTWLATAELGALGPLSSKASSIVTFRSKAIGAPVCKVQQIDRSAIYLDVMFVPGTAQDRFTQTTGAAHSTA